jgi:hypothetical protein
MFALMLTGEQAEPVHPVGVGAGGVHTMKFVSHVPAQTSPLVSTETLVLLLAQVGVNVVRVIPFTSDTVAVMVCTSPGFMEMIVGVTEIEFGWPPIVHGHMSGAFPPHAKIIEHRIARAAMNADR